MSDAIVIKGLQVMASVGVPAAERVAPQGLGIDLLLETNLAGMGDDLAKTTDYAAVAAWVRAECHACEFQLLEALAEHLACGLLAAFPRVVAVSIEVRKFILPHTRHVAVRLRRERD